MELSSAAQRSGKVDLAAIAKHPVRMQAFDVLAQRTASPIEIARELHKDVSNVSYHVRELEKMGAVELIRERKVRGSTEHFYRALEPSFLQQEEWDALTAEERLEYTIYVLRLCVSTISRSVDGGLFDSRPDRWLTRIPLLLDEKGWAELAEVHKELAERTMQIRVDAANRLTVDQVPIKVQQIAMFFEEP
jgi:DNA-binding transcriptional ArsR family regulator